MNKVNAWIKSKTADRVLSPLREAIVKLVPESSSVLEVGCGTGDLLFRLSHKIKYGVGVDLERGMIDWANERKTASRVTNLDFVFGDVTSSKKLVPYEFDVSTSSLCLHEMTTEDAVSTLKFMAECAPTLIIADFTEPNTKWGKASIELDEMFSGHYRRFKRYSAIGGMPYLAMLAGLEIQREIGTPKDGIAIWDLRAKFR